MPHVSICCAPFLIIFYFETVILENHLGRAGADDLVPMFVMVLARSDAHNIKSILAFIDDFFDPRMRL